MAKITNTRITKKGQRGVVHCDSCGNQHKVDATVKTLIKITKRYDEILCESCVDKYQSPIGITKVKCWLMDHGLQNWYGIRVADQDECESLYRSMALRDYAVEKLGL